MKTQRSYILPLRLLIIAAGSGLLFTITLFLGRLIDSKADFAILLAINPDNRIPGLDELVIFITDFSVYTFSLLVVSWQIAYYIVRKHDSRKLRAKKVFLALGLGLGLYHALGYFFHDWGIFYWGEYTHKIVFPFLGLVFLVLYTLAGRSFVAWKQETQDDMAGVFWLTLLTVLFTNPLGEDFLKEIVGRPRPLNDFYSPWNEAVRPIADEVVRGGSSYISGHASSFFALTTPLFWAVRCPMLRVGLFSWAFLHAWTRVYTAAHFPWDITMGGLYGFLIGTMVYWTFRWHSKRNTDELQ